MRLMPFLTHKGKAAALLIGGGLFFSGCGTISTYQTGKTVPKGKLSFGLGTSAGLFRTKSHIVGFPIELAYGSAELFMGYGLFDFLDLQLKAMAAQYTSSEDFKSLGGIPAVGGGSARLALAQERWGFPFSIAVGYGYYGGSAQSRRTDIKNTETNRKLTGTTDRVAFVNVSKDLLSWLTPYGALKFYNRTTHNRNWDKGKLTLDETLRDKLNGYGAGLSFNVGRDKNAHIMLEMNSIRDTDEPDKHYQKQAGIGMSVEF
ncbi:MAG: hypothetical protein HY401_10370 [Elusimicrobia bacterium]|nr:hypothetical protein [Elusimicrobiota bacterium]